ncbi:hypothetical protein [Paenibacillus alkalitolerans]|uniref:hypothetical protein n=1 Tax=Paenibacillus alkalitolerans TaxID=2799335 RepID=UPI0018F4E3EB|nr:hypothetical protein [Paenibacillus alkalitolerans]
MLRNRTYLFGLGTGLIAAALVLQLVFEAEKVSFRDTDEPETPIGIEQVQEAAAKLGYEVYKRDEPVYTSDEVEQRVQDALKKESAEKKQSYAFSIGPGTDVSSIAHMLVEMGLVGDWRLFVDEIEKRSLADSVQARYYIFEEKPDMKSLIAELTSPR